MTSIHSMTAGNYWKASDLNGGTMSVTIVGFAIENVDRDGKSEQSCVAKLLESDKGIVIRAKDNVVPLLERFKTDQIEEWDSAVKQSPLPVTLFTAQTNLGPGIRIRIESSATVQVQSNSIGVGQNNPLSMFTPEQLAALSPEQIASISGGAS